MTMMVVASLKRNMVVQSGCKKDQTHHKICYFVMHKGSMQAFAKHMLCACLLPTKIKSTLVKTVLAIRTLKRYQVITSSLDSRLTVLIGEGEERIALVQMT